MKGKRIVDERKWISINPRILFGQIWPETVKNDAVPSPVIENSSICRVKNLKRGNFIISLFDKFLYVEEEILNVTGETCN